MKSFVLCFFISLLSLSQAQDKTFTETPLNINMFIDGTLTLPLNANNSSLAIIIGGSGPTDRNGNQNFLKNDALKKLAHALASNGISSFRYDKRIVKQIQQRNIDPNILFNDFVTDAISVINYFKKSKQYKDIYIIGHSQGSLVGMLAAKDRADGFISLAGAGQNIGDVLVEQISTTAPQFTEDTKNIVEKLKSKKKVNEYPEALASVFRKDIQAFMMNWMEYTPFELIKELKLPILIVNGSKDLQVSIDEAKLLKEYASDAEIYIIEKMNHVLVEIEGDDLENSKSYNEPYRKISPKLIKHISTFILSDK